MTRDRNLQFRGVVSTGLLNFLQCIFSCFSRFTVQFSKEIAQIVEKFARFLGGAKSVESCHVSGCHGFFGPELEVRGRNVYHFTIQANFPDVFPGLFLEFSSRTPEIIPETATAFSEFS